MDTAASEFYKDGGKYDLDFKNPDSDPSTWLTCECLCLLQIITSLFFLFLASQLTEIYQGFIKDYPIVSIEDGFDQDDWEGWKNFTSQTDIQVINIFYAKLLH